MTKFERERKQEDPNFVGSFRHFMDDFARMSFMLRKVDDIIKEKFQRREAKEKGVEYKGKPIDPAPKAQTEEAPAESSKGGAQKDEGVTIDQVRKIERGKAKISDFAYIQEDFDTLVLPPSPPRETFQDANAKVFNDLDRALIPSTIHVEEEDDGGLLLQITLWRMAILLIPLRLDHFG